MKRIDFTCASYNLKLKEPFNTSKGVITERKGYLIQLKSDTGKSGTGDASPFPEFGTETYAEAEEVLKSLKLNIRINVKDIESSIIESLSPLDKFPSLHHGFEQALISLISKENNISINEILNESSKKIFHVNAVIGLLTPDETSKATLRLIKEGYSAIKIKAGRENFEDDLNSIKASRNAAGNKINLRIDVNGKWTLKDAIDNLNRLKPFNIEYVEQPVSSLVHFIKLKSQSPIPLAVDESIRTVKDAAEFIQKKAADVIILKPMMLGGIIPLLLIKNLAEQNGIKVVVTTSFESVVGRSIAVFAASTVKGEMAHGLATAGLFEKDLFPDPYPVQNGIISLETK